MLDPGLVERIHSIFLHQGASVSISDTTALLGWSRSEMTAAIAGGEIEATVTCAGKVIAHEELVAAALELWPMDVIEEALGKDAARVLPEPVRTREVYTRLPRYQVAMLEYMAEQQNTTLGAVLARELDGLASAHAEELAAAIPGFAAALAWPDAKETQQPC